MDNKIDWNVLYETALELAVTAHKGQVDKAGKPYIQHSLHVAAQFSDLTMQIIALLHDVVEDCNVSIECINKTFPAIVTVAIDILTHKKWHSYEDYIEGIKLKEDTAIIQVKIADLCHNMDIKRIPNPTQEDFNRLAQYAAAYKYLNG